MPWMVSLARGRSWYSKCWDRLSVTYTTTKTNLTVTEQPGESWEKTLSPSLPLSLSLSAPVLPEAYQQGIQTPQQHQYHGYMHQTSMSSVRSITSPPNSTSMVMVALHCWWFCLCWSYVQEVWRGWPLTLSVCPCMLAACLPSIVWLRRPGPRWGLL